MWNISVAAGLKAQSFERLHMGQDRMMVGLADAHTPPKLPD